MKTDKPKRTVKQVCALCSRDFSVPNQSGRPPASGNPCAKCGWDFNLKGASATAAST